MTVLHTAYYQGHTYYLLGTDGTHWWTDAEVEAQALGGHLVTINTGQENQWILDTFSSEAIAYASANNLPDQTAISFWIGLSEAMSEGAYSWSNDEVTTYVNWANGQPENDYLDEDYIGMFVNFLSPGAWHDLVGDTRLEDLPFGIVELPYMLGTARRDILTGSALNDSIRGEAGADKLRGKSGADIIIGGDGSDRLIGGRGADYIKGGTGNDVFSYFGLREGGDLIGDFSHDRPGNNDQFEFSGLAFGGLVAGSLAADLFQSGNMAVALTDEVRFFYEEDRRILRFDADGAGAQKAVVIAIFEVAALVTIDDLVII